MRQVTTLSLLLDGFKADVNFHFIADELHSLAENKRGSMAVVAAERLEELVERPMTYLSIIIYPRN